jgi:hypothetical protein
MKGVVLSSLLIAIWPFLSNAQKFKSLPGTYLSKDTTQPRTLILKPGSGKTISGIYYSNMGREYIYLALQDNQLMGYFLSANTDKTIRIGIMNDSLDVTFTDKESVDKFTLFKLKTKENNSLTKAKFDKGLLGKWVYFDEKAKQLIKNQYFIYYPGGNLEFHHPEHSEMLSHEVIRSGKLKLKWATQDQLLYMYFETTLPLSVPNSISNAYRIVGDTLYKTNSSGKVFKSVKDKSFDP